MASDREQYQFTYLDSQVTLSCPAVRLLYIECGISDDGEHEWVTVFPVVSLQCSLRTQYSRKIKGCAVPVPGSHEDLLQECWKVYSQEIHVEPLIVEEGMIITPSDDCDLSGQLIAAPWPEFQDDDRLHTIKKTMAKNLRRACQARQAGRAEFIPEKEQP